VYYAAGVAGAAVGDYPISPASAIDAD